MFVCGASGASPSCPIAERSRVAPMPSRIERKLLHILDEIKVIEAERVLIQAELEAHRLIDSDAHRDAALGIEPLESTLTRDDVFRFERLLARLENRRLFLEAKRSALLDRLGD
jgi:hypothetical protein